MKHQYNWNIRENIYEQAAALHKDLAKILEAICNHEYKTQYRLLDLKNNAATQKYPEWRLSLKELLMYSFFGDKDFKKYIHDTAITWSNAYKGSSITATEKKTGSILKHLNQEWKNKGNNKPKKHPVVKPNLKDKKIIKTALTAKTQTIDKEYARNSIRKEIKRNIKNRGILILNIDPGFGKTHTGALTVTEIIKTNKNERFCWTAPQYPALEESGRVFLKYGDPKEITIIPQPTDDIDEASKHCSKFYCPRSKYIASHRGFGLNYQQNVCHDCPLRNNHDGHGAECPLYANKKKAASKANMLTLAHASHLCINDMRKRCIDNHHLILDEDQLSSLLNFNEITSSSLIQFRRLLVLAKNRNGIKKETILMCKKLLNLCKEITAYTNMAIDKKRQTKVIPTPPSLIKFIKDVSTNEEMQKTLRKIKVIFRQIIIEKRNDGDTRQFFNLIDQLLSINPSKILISPKRLSFNIISANPVDLSSVLSITILDASANLEIIRYLLTVCNVDLEKKKIREVSYQTPKTAQTFTYNKSSFSRSKLKKMTNQQNQALVNGLNNFIETHKYQMVFLATYKNKGEKQHKTITYLEDHLKHLDKTPLHFGGRMTIGQNELPRIIKEHGFLPENCLLIVFGTPTTNIEHISKVCYGLGLFKENENPPEFINDINKTPVCMDGETPLDITTYDDPQWSLIHQHSIESQTFQTIARATHRDIPALILNKVPLLLIPNKKIISIGKTKQQLQREDEKNQLLPLFEKEIRKQINTGKAVTRNSICKEVGKTLNKDLCTRKYLDIVSSLIKKLKKERAS